ncbi:unnamed protein product, partial [Onchocerca flexuosa]|uniref:ULP_PROTEASE domain-containing protein n=2 Tax=Onchocerca flexuosa TaxID=387005 RepID=A0A183H6K0_9BILA
ITSLIVLVKFQNRSLPSAEKTGNSQSPGTVCGSRCSQLLLDLNIMNDLDLRKVHNIPKRLDLKQFFASFRRSFNHWCLLYEIPALANNSSIEGWGFDSHYVTVHKLVVG